MLILKIIHQQMKKIFAPVALASIVVIGFSQTSCKSTGDKKGVGINLAAIARMQTWNASPMFDFGAGQDPKNSEVIVPQINQGGLSLPDRDYYTKTDSRSQMIRDEFIKHMAKMFALYGTSEAEGKKNA